MFASYEWERERTSLSERIQQLERELGTLRMGQDDAAHDSDREDS